MKRIITDQQVQKIIELSAKGYKNRQIAIELGMKHATLQSWKMKLRKQGITLPAQLGRPRRGKVASYNATIDEYNKAQKY